MTAFRSSVEKAELERTLNGHRIMGIKFEDSLGGETMHLHIDDGRVIVVGVVGEYMDVTVTTTQDRVTS